MGRIVYMMVFVLRIIADIDRLNRDQPFVNRTPRNTCVQSPLPSPETGSEYENSSVSPIFIQHFHNGTFILGFSFHLQIQQTVHDMNRYGASLQIDIQDAFLDGRE